MKNMQKRKQKNTSVCEIQESILKYVVGKVCRTGEQVSLRQRTD